MSIDKRPSGQYQARWREVPGGPQKTATFDRKIDAQRHLTAMTPRSCMAPMSTLRLARCA